MEEKCHTKQEILTCSVTGSCKEQGILLSLPNSGTNWFMRNYVPCMTYTKYSEEYFNPEISVGNKGLLSSVFGSGNKHGNNAISWDTQQDIERVYEDTWVKSGFDCTKEVWSQFKVGFFFQKFDCFVLVRSIEHSLPQTRPFAREKFGQAFFNSLVMNRNTLEPDIQEMVDISTILCSNNNLQTVAGYAMMTYQLLKEAFKYDIPVVEYDKMMQASLEDMEQLLIDVPGVNDVKKLSASFVNTRKFTNRNFESLGARELLSKLSAIMGEEYVRIICPSMEVI